MCFLAHPATPCAYGHVRKKKKRPRLPTKRIRRDGRSTSSICLIFVLCTCANSFTSGVASERLLPSRCRWPARHCARRSASGVVVAFRFPTTQCAPLWPSLGWETGELTSVRQRASLTTSSGTCLAVRHRARAALFQEWCHKDSLPQGPRKTRSDPQSQVADEDLVPVQHVPSDFSVCMPSIQEISEERTPRSPRVLETPQAPSILSNPGSRTVEGARLLHACVAHTPVLPTNFQKKV